MKKTPGMNFKIFLKWNEFLVLVSFPTIFLKYCILALMCDFMRTELKIYVSERPSYREEEIFHMLVPSTGPPSAGFLSILTGAQPPYLSPRLLRKDSWTRAFVKILMLVKAPCEPSLWLWQKDPDCEFCTQSTFSVHLHFEWQTLSMCLYPSLGMAHGSQGHLPLLLGVSRAWVSITAQGSSPQQVHLQFIYICTQVFMVCPPQIIGETCVQLGCEWYISAPWVTQYRPSEWLYCWGYQCQPLNWKGEKRRKRKSRGRERKSRFNQLQ